MIGKAFILLGAIALSLTVYNLSRPSQSEIRQLWTSWKAQYSISYDTIEEDEYRFSVFLSHYNFIQETNAQGLPYTLALNKFASLTPAEWKSIYASGLPTDPNAPVDEYCPSAVNCPSFPATNLTAQNWTANGAVTPIKNQLQCGSCWAFSTTGSLEGLNFLNTGNLLSFSEQELVDCATKCEGCDGCWPYLAMEFAAEKGIELESQYPYVGVQQKCKYNATEAQKVNAGYKCVPQKSVADMMGAGTAQPVSIAVEADQAVWQFYSGGVVDRNCGDTLDHAVLNVGWTTINGVNTWIVKNSWGVDWGVNGYIFITQAQNSSVNTGFGVCGILRCGTVPTPLNSTL